MAASLRCITSSRTESSGIRNAGERAGGRVGREVDLGRRAERRRGEELAGERADGEAGGAEAGADQQSLDMRQTAEEGRHVGAHRAEADAGLDDAPAREARRE